MAKKIRFAVGSREDTFSSVWRVWVSNSELYLAARTTAGLTKLSFHKSGICRLAVVSQTPRPALKSWRRPDLNDSATPLFSVVVPFVFRSDRLRDKPTPPNTPIVWVDPPQPGTKIVFRLLQTKGTFTDSDLVSLIKVQDRPMALHGSLKLPWATVWLVSFAEWLTLPECEIIAGRIGNTKATLAPGSSKSSIDIAFMHAYQADNMSVVDLPLGLDNIVVSPS